MTVRVRMAPTPSGNLHLGTAHTAMFNWLFARHNDGKFVLRIDDSDPKRYKKEYEKNIIDSLRWLGIDWDEGPDVGGPYGPYRQSQRMAKYWEYVEKLLKKGKAYYCFCAPEELEKERKKMQKKGVAPKYLGKCRKLTPKQSKERLSRGEKAAVRLKVEPGNLSFTDPSRGKISVKAEDIGDFVIARSDKTALLVVATTVDDIEMKITHTIRGEDYLNFIPRQLLLYKALGVKPPIFANISFIYGPDGAKLSKRHGATSVSEYQKLGYLPEALFNYLVLLGWSPKDDKEIVSIDEIVKLFDLKDVKDAGPRFDIDKLDWMNGQYIQKLSDSKLKTLITDYIGNKYDENVIVASIPLVKSRMKKLSDYLSLCGFLFKARKVNKKLFRSNWQKHVRVALEKLQKLADWSADEIGDTLMKGVVKNGFKTGDFFMTLRIAISGSKITPPLNESLVILGKQETLKRLGILI